MQDVKWYPALLIPLVGAAGCSDNGETTSDSTGGAPGVGGSIDAGAPGIGGEGGDIVVYYGPPETGGSGSGGDATGGFPVAEYGPLPIGGTGGEPVAFYGPMPIGGSAGEAPAGGVGTGGVDRPSGGTGGVDRPAGGAGGAIMPLGGMGGIITWYGPAPTGGTGADSAGGTGAGTAGGAAGEPNNGGAAGEGPLGGTGGMIAPAYGPQLTGGGPAVYYGPMPVD